MALLAMVPSMGMDGTEVELVQAVTLAWAVHLHIEPAYIDRIGLSPVAGIMN